MNARSRRALVGSLFFVGACAAPFRREAQKLAAQIEEAKSQGAVLCSPRALALAEAHLDFSLTELSSGEYFAAEEMLQKARRHTAQALQVAGDDKCQRSRRAALDSDGD